MLNFDKHQNPHVKEQAREIPAPDLPGVCPVQGNDKPNKSTEVAGLIPSSLNPHPEVEATPLVASKLPTCPQQQIIGLFADELPDLPQPRVWDGVREKNLRTRWRWVIADLKDKGKPCADADALAFFRRMFAYIRKSDFLMGRSGGWSCPGLHWIVEGGNFAKIIEGAYENKEAA